MENINKELVRAVSGQNLEDVKALLSAGADPNHRIGGWSDDTLLHRSYSADITKELLLGGAKVNSTNRYKETPLYSAVTLCGKLDVIRELLKHGANVNTINRMGNTALHHVVKKNSINLEVLKELLKYGSDINISDCGSRRLCDNGFTPLDNAVSDLEAAKLLIKFTLVRNFNKDYETIIDLSPYKCYRNYCNLLRFLEDCVCEILQMKTDEIKDGLLLYDIVTKPLNKNVLYDNKLPIRLAKIDYFISYPIYKDIILDKLKPFLKRADLLNKLSEIQFYTKLDQERTIILDPDSTYCITEYLSNDCLLNFIKAFDDSSNFTSPSLSCFNDLVEPCLRNDGKRTRFVFIGSH